MNPLCEAKEDSTILPRLDEVRRQAAGE